MGEVELRILLDEARKEYDHLLDIIKHNGNRISSIIALLPVFVGIVVTSTVYVYVNLDILPSDKLFVEPNLFAIILLIIAFLIGLIGILPVKREIFILPSELYRIKNKSEENILDNLLQNYLVELNGIYSAMQIKPLITNVIVIMTIMSMVEFSLFGMYHFTDAVQIEKIMAQINLTYIPLIIGGITILLIVVIYYIDFNRLKQQLNGD
jgi:hypothetical protein